jgi:RNA methyltransferase, TrmH family
VLAAVSQTETPPGVLAVLRGPEAAPLSTHGGDAFGLVLDRLGDPGNAGSILRTADAAGTGYVVATPDTVDLYAPKVVRAGMGAHFRLPLYQGVSWDELAVALPGTDLVATKPNAGDSVFNFRWPPRAALIVGSEAHGLSAPLDRVAHWVHIPMRQGVESLNASVAASIAIYAALGSSIA